MRVATLHVVGRRNKFLDLSMRTATRSSGLSWSNRLGFVQTVEIKKLNNINTVG